MASSNTKLIAVALVAIIAIAAIAAFFMLNNGDNNKKDDSWQKDVTGRLQVYGNANGDDYINDDDLKAIDSFISSGSWDKTKYPYADANGDGKITGEDRAMVEKMIAGEPVDVRYVNGNGDIKTAHYPVTGLVVGGTAVHPVINATGAYDKAVALTGKSGSVDENLNKKTYNLPSVGAKAYSLNVDELSKYPTVNAVFTLNTSVYDSIETVLEPIEGISCIRINPDDSDRSTQTFLLVGFLTGHSDQAAKIVAFYDKYNKVIADNVAKIKNQKTTLTMYSYSMCGTDYYLTKNTVAAGAKNLSDFTDNTKKIKDNPEWAADEKYQAEYIIEFTGMDMIWKPTTEEMKEEFEYYGQYFTLMKAYPENYVVINKDMPDIARTAYAAQVLYPDVFGADFGDKLYKELVSVFYPYVGSFNPATDTVVVIDYEDAYGTGGDTSWKTDITNRLEVYGNANGDDVMDSNDLKAIDWFINNSWDSTTYSFADANGDGKVTSDDREIVRKILAGESVDVRYINGNGDVKTAHYPVTGLVVGGTAVHPVINATGAYDKAVALTGKSGSVDENLNKKTYNLPSVGAKAYSLNVDELSKYPTVNAVFTLNTSVYDSIETVLEPIEGISCIRINPDDSDRSTQTFLLVGFLTGHSDQAAKIVAFYDKYNKVIADNVAKIKNQKTTLTMYSYSMCGTDYYLTKNTVAAGAKNLSDFTDNTKKIKDNPEWAADEKYQAEYIIQYNGLDMIWNPTADEMKEEFEYYGQYYTLMKAYPQNYVVINKNMPDIARTAYVAQVLYPDVFGADFGDKLYKELVSVFYPYVGSFDPATDTTVIVDYDMISLAGKGFYAWNPAVVTVDGNYSNCTPAFMDIAESVYKKVYGAVPDYSEITRDAIPSEYLYSYNSYVTENSDGTLTVKTFDNTSLGTSEAFADKKINFTPTKILCYTDAYVDTIYMILCDYYGEEAHSGNTPKSDAKLWELITAIPESVKSGVQSKYSLAVPDSVTVIGGSQEDLLNYCASISSDDKLIVFMSEYNIRSTNKSSWWATNTAIEQKASNVQFIYLLSNSPAMVLSTMEMIGKVIGYDNTDSMMTSVLAKIYVMQKAIDDSGVKKTFYTETAAGKSVGSNTLMGGIFASILKLDNVYDGSLMGSKMSDEDIVKAQPDVIGFYKADTRSLAEKMRAA